MAKAIDIKLQEGDPAPSFHSINQHEQPIGLSDFKGKHVILYFYPRDNTPGCTKEACAFRDAFAQLESMGVVVLGVSCDNVSSHQKFISKFELPFDLLADTSQEIVKAYGVWGPKQFMGKTFDGIHRVSFWINPEGLIERIWTKVKPDVHATDVIEAIKAFE